MSNSPHMPANMPIAQQRIVRGDAVRRLPGVGFSTPQPRFHWEGLVTTGRQSHPWFVDTTASYIAAWVTQATDQAALEIDIYVNGVLTDSIVTTGLAVESVAITVAVERHDYIQLICSDDGAGTGEDVEVLLSGRTIAPAPPAPEPDPGDLFAWYDAADLATVTESGGLVTVWADKGTLGIDVTASGGLRPGIGGDDLNGLTTMNFNGSNKFQAPGGTTPEVASWIFLNNGTQHLILVVAKLTATTGNERLLLGNMNSVNGNGTMLLDDRADTKFTHLVGNSGGGSNPCTNETAASFITPDEWFIMSIASNGSAGTPAGRSVIRINNGAGVSNNAQNFSYNATNPSFALHIGDTPNDNFGWEGSIAEILILNDLSLEAANYEYLSDKWGIG